MAGRQRDGREEWRGVWINELHGDYLAHDRLPERRARVARAALVAGGRPPRTAPRWRGLAARVVRVVRLLL